MTGQGTTIQIPRGEGLFWTLIYTPAALFTVVVVGLTLPATVPNKGYTQFSTVFGSLTFLVQILAESLFSVLLFTLIFRTLVLLENTFRHPQSEMITQGNSQTSKSESHHSSFPWRGVASWVLSCLIFGLLHLKTYDFNVAQAIVLIGSNLFLGFIVYLATGNYWILYISHVWGDLISFSPHCFGPVFIYGSGIILLLLGITFFGAVVFKKTSALECIGRRITLQLRSQEQYSPENGFSYQTSEDAESKNDD